MPLQVKAALNRASARRAHSSRRSFGQVCIEKLARRSEALGIDAYRQHQFLDGGANQDVVVDDDDQRPILLGNAGNHGWTSPGWFGPPARHHACVEPASHFSSKVRRRLAGHRLADIGEAMGGERVAHRLLRLQHHDVDRAYPAGRPARRRIAEQRAAVADILAIEQRLAPFDGIDDLQEADVLRRPGEQIAPRTPSEATTMPLRSSTGNILAREAGRDALKHGPVPDSSLAYRRPLPARAGSGCHIQRCW